MNRHPYTDLDQTYTLDKDITITVNRVTGRAVTIDWTDIPSRYFKDDTSEAILEYSDSPVSEFEQVITFVKGHPPTYYDQETILNNFRNPVIYYRLRFPDVHKVTQAFSSEKLPNLYGAEISRRHAILLKEGHAGNLAYLFIKRRTKEQCPYCFDTLRGQRSAVNCKHCLNTGFISGYYDPIPIYVSWSPENVALTQPLEGTAFPLTMQGWTTGYPRISIGDILVDADTREIWIIHQVSLTTHKRTPTKQELVVKYQEEDLHVFDLLEKVPKIGESTHGRHGQYTY